MPLTEPLRLKILWLFLAVSAIAAIEPSPYDGMFFVCILAFAKGGLAFEPTLAPLIFTLFVFNAAGLVALIPYTDESTSVSFTFITFYITMTTVLFATLVAANPLPRMKTIRSGYTFAAVVAAFLGVIGYFNVAGLSPYFTLYDGGRAAGPFKDPNVFAPFLVAPIGWVAQDVILKRAPNWRSVPMILIMLLGVFLSFSRGALIDTLFTLALVLGLTFVTTRSGKLKRRIATSTIVGVVLFAALAAIILSVPSIRELALERATLTEDYDSGQQGRFGNQIRSIPMLLDRPLGFGPFRFADYFPADPHEVFLSAFASFGWAGGIAFAVFVALTLYVGFVFAFRRASTRTEFIGVFSAMLPQLLQGVQIDTMHWRHLFLLIGCLFGLAAAAHRETIAAARLADRNLPAVA
jgi:hypothetical protein